MSAAPDAGAEAIRQVETLRCSAIGSGDIAALSALLLPDYVHVHANGRVTDKAQTLDRVAASPRTATRGALDIRLWHDAALVVGEQTSATADGAMRGIVTQTLRRTAAGWRFASFQITTIAAPAARG